MYFDKDEFADMFELLFTFRYCESLMDILARVLMWVIFPISISICLLGSIKIK